MVAPALKIVAKPGSSTRAPACSSTLVATVTLPASVPWPASAEISAASLVPRLASSLFSVTGPEKRSVSARAPKRPSSPTSVAAREAVTPRPAPAVSRASTWPVTESAPP